MLVGAASLASRVLGFVRDMLMAWLLGGGPAADALVVALRLPHVLRRLLGDGSLSMTLTAHLAHCRQQQNGTAASFALAWAVTKRIALLTGVLVLGAELLARPLIDCLAPGLSAHATGAATAVEAASLFRICLPYAFAAGMAALGMAFLHSAGYFLLPALSPLCFNTVIIAFALLAAVDVGSPATMLACGFLAGGLVQWLLPCLALWRMQLWQYRTPPPPPDTLRACLRSLPAGLLGAAAPQIAMLCAMAAASFLPAGSVSALYYAERLLELPMSITGTALGMVSLPTLAALTATRQHRAFASHCSTAVRLALLLALPATAGLLAVSHPLVAVLLGHGAFDSHAVTTTAMVLSAYTCSLPLYAVSRPLLAACNARKLTRHTAFSGAAAVVGTCGAALLFLYVLPPPHAVLGPPLAVGLGLGLQTVILWRVLRQHVHAALVNEPLPCETLPSAPHAAAASESTPSPHLLCFVSPALYTMLFASLLTFGAARLMLHLISSPPVALVAGIIAGVSTYTLSLLLLGHEDTRSLTRWCRRMYSALCGKGKK